METHTPVLLEEVLHYLEPQPGKNYIDGTFGQGGHARAVLERIRPDGRLIVIDRDPETLSAAASLGPNVIVRQGNFADLLTLAEDVLPNLPIHGVLFDCGISSTQLADPKLGLSFANAGALDMRLDRGKGMSASDIVNSWPETEIANLIWSLGEEKGSRRIAKAIVTARRQARLTTTTELARIVSEAVGGRHGHLHPATKTFQALRMGVNDELGSLKRGLDAALSVLAVGGRLVVISFHSLEDRIVKERFREAAKKCVCDPAALRCTCDRKAFFQVLTKRPVTPARKEILQNPRSRSAKLRGLERIRL